MMNNKLSAVAGAGIATVALSLALVGCGSDSKKEETSTSSTTSSAESSTSEAVTTSIAPPSTPEAAGPNKTIADYIKENNIQETPIKPGDPGPSLELPVPDGWQMADNLGPEYYGGIIFQQPQVPDNPPRILAVFSKLTGNVDPQQILALAPGELRNLPGYDGPTEGNPDKLDGYDATVLGGTYEIDGKKGMIAQKTVVIPGQDGMYILQLNAYSDEAEASTLMDATTQIDEQTTITP